MNTKNRSEGHSILQKSTINQKDVFRVCSFLQVFGFVTIIVQFLIPFLILAYCYTKIALVLHKRVVKVRITLNRRLLHVQANHCTLHEQQRILTNTSKVSDCRKNSEDQPSLFKVEKSQQNYVWIFPVYLRMVLIFTDFKRAHGWDLLPVGKSVTNSNVILLPLI